MLGIMVDMPVVTVVALYKSPYMLFKGWHRLLHDLIGREGPFLETACVPFAGLFILLWPLAVMGAVLASVISSFFLGAYAAVVVHQVWFISEKWRMHNTYKPYKMCIPRLVMSFLYHITWDHFSSSFPCHFFSGYCLSFEADTLFIICINISKTKLVHHLFKFRLSSSTEPHHHHYLS